MVRRLEDKAQYRNIEMGGKDVTVVPFGDLNDSLNALVQGRIDATVYGMGAPRIREAVSRVGVRFINDDCSPEGKARILGSVTVAVKFNANIFNRQARYKAQDPILVIVK